MALVALVFLLTYWLRRKKRRDEFDPDHVTSVDTMYGNGGSGGEGILDESTSPIITPFPAYKGANGHGHDMRQHHDTGYAQGSPRPSHPMPAYSQPYGLDATSPYLAQQSPTQGWHPHAGYGHANYPGGGMLPAAAAHVPATGYDYYQQYGSQQTPSTYKAASPPPASSSGTLAEGGIGRRASTLVAHQDGGGMPDQGHGKGIEEEEHVAPEEIPPAYDSISTPRTV